MTDEIVNPEAAAKVVAGAATGGGFFWWLARSYVSARERIAEDFRNEVRADLKELKKLAQESLMDKALLAQRVTALEREVHELRSQLREMSEGR